MVTIKNNTYGLRLLETGDYMLIKNDRPVWVIPDDLYEDFAQILSYAGTAAKFMEENPASNDQEKVDILSGTTPIHGEK